MSLVWMDGFEGYGTGATNPSMQLARRYAVGDTQYFSIVAGRTGGYAVKSVNGSYYFQTPALTTNGTMIVSFGYKTDYAIQSYNICFLFDGDTQGMGLALTAGGDIQVCRGGAVLATTTGLACVTNTWYFIEFKVVCGSAGSYELRVNGNTVLSATGVNTQAGSHAYHDRVRFWAAHTAILAQTISMSVTGRAASTTISSATTRSSACFLTPMGMRPSGRAADRAIITRR